MSPGPISGSPVDGPDVNSVWHAHTMKPEENDMHDYEGALTTQIVAAHTA